jgi:hypothetical protein
MLCFLLTCVLCSLNKLQAQDGVNYALHANIIYRFTKYVDWPEAKKQGDFVIGIVGDSPLFDEMKSFITNKTVGNQRIVVQKVSASASVYNCHILFVSDEESGSIKKIAGRTKNSPVLLVSESDGSALQGSCINFIIVSEHLKLEINKNNIDTRQLSIASELLQLGKLVK